MLIIIVAFASLTILSIIAVLIFNRFNTGIVPEDHALVTVNRAGFIKRVLPAGRFRLQPFERVDFTLETKTKLEAGRATNIATSDGILLKISWSGVYAVCPDLIGDEYRSQRLRSLPQAGKAIDRNVDIYLRKLVGNHRARDLHQPAIRERVERQLNATVADRLKALGIVLYGLNLQTIELPQDVTEALNKAVAIETLDSAIRHIDPTTRDVVRGAYQLNEILHWDQYLPVPSRATMKRLEAITHP